MLVALRTWEILALLSLIGLPLNLLLLSSTEFGASRFGVSGRILLAPVSGLAVFAIFVSLFFVSGRPVNDAAGPFWVLLVAVWLGLVVARRHTIVQVVRQMPGQYRCGAWMYLLVLGGLVLALIPYLWSFLRDPGLVLWHYAGSDVYFYLMTSEYYGTVGSSRIPEPGVYEAAWGFVHYVLVNLHQNGVAERPGTFSTLAGLGSVFGLLPHETFSPLVIATVGMLYLSLVILARYLGLPIVLSVVGALLSVTSPAVWLMAEYTFLGNLLAMPILPVMLLLPRPSLTPRIAVYGGITVAGLIWLYNEVAPAALAMTVPLLLFLAWQTHRASMLRSYVSALGIGVATSCALALPLAAPLIAFPLRIYLSIVTRGSTDTATASLMSRLRPLSTWNWLWPAFNLNGLPPQPLKSEEVPFLATFIALTVLYLGLSVWRKQIDVLWFYAVNMALFIAASVFGLFPTDYELFRALILLPFVPILVLLQAPRQIVGQKYRAARWLVAVAVTVVLARFALNDFEQVKFGFVNQLSDTRYSAQNIVDRSEITKISRSQTIVLLGDTATFTAFANILALFSTARPGIPTHFYKYVFFESTPDSKILYLDVPRGAQYESDLVLRNLRYADIYEPEAARPAVYRSEEFALFDNDLIPFFDNDTFPVLSYLPASRRLPVGRTLSKQTDVFLFNQHESTIHVELEGDPSSPPVALRYALDGGESATVERTADGHFVFPPVRVSQGLHRLIFEPTDGPIVIKRMSVWR